MMRLQPLFKDAPAGFQLFLFLGLLVFGLLAGMITGMLFIHFTDGLSNISLVNPEGPEALKAARIMQVCSQIGLFFFPPFAYAILLSRKPSSFLGINKIAQPVILFPAILLMFISLPAVHFLSEINKSVHLPVWLSSLEEWMQDKEAQAEKLTNFFLSVDTIGGLMINLIMIALLPAMGEELVFRSVLQPKFIGILKNPHIGIIVTALVFSIIHMQFYGLLPRFALGLFLGYFYYWSGSIWVPMVMHLVNNGAAVIAFYLHHNEVSGVSMDKLGESTSLLTVLLSAVFSLFLVLFGLRISKSMK
ncbi:MAG TPA: CPBP family intramembrane metalloprotease [Bacteroidales bacterium]|nr:CPBP family intramembrane metalloprotease [Bacteroidales bacterium]HQQ12051.1 CPBP family intramembrane metalloprotease [Bacteroidales bacterium]